ncbi:MAG: tetratricopeptide repeat protein, partial [Alphaproteobacteria bacterium]|nr:tetratricopeptide repeat protein [Alphaproteobacteria bacterium]
HPAAYYSRGIVYGHVRDWVRAIEDFSRVVVLDPTSRDAYYLRALAYEIAGLDEQALADYSKMIELKPSDIDAYAERRTINRRLGNFDAAAADAGALTSLASKSETPSPTTTAVQPYTGEVYVLDCMLRDGSSVPGYMHAREEGKPADYDYSLWQRDPKTGYCKDEVEAQHRRNILANQEALKRKLESESNEARRVGASSVTAVRSSAESPRGYWLEDVMRDKAINRSGRQSDDLSAAGKPILPPEEPEYTSRLRAPAYDPSTPSAVVTHMDAETCYRTTPRAPGSINNMDTRYNPYETTSEALHGRGRRYDPYATQDSWAYDRANPYAIAPQYKYGVTNPRSPSGTYYNPSTTLGGGPQPNNWQTNRYDPYGTQRKSTPMSGLNQVPLVPLNPPSNCPRQPTSILNSNGKQC